MFRLTNRWKQTASRCAALFCLVVARSTHCNEHERIIGGLFER